MQTSGGKVTPASSNAARGPSTREMSIFIRRKPASCVVSLPLALPIPSMSMRKPRHHGSTMYAADAQAGRSI